MKTKTRILLEQFEIATFLPHPVAIRNLPAGPAGSRAISPGRQPSPETACPSFKRGEHAGTGNRDRANAPKKAARTRFRRSAIAHPPVFVLSPAGELTFYSYGDEKDPAGGG